MIDILTNREKQNLLLFKVLPNLNYGIRIMVSFSVIITGFACQFYTPLFWVGFLLIAAGNLLLLVNGYDNRVTFNVYSPNAKWEAVEGRKITELIELQRKMYEWDRSFFDISNVVGLFGLIAFLGFAFVAAMGLTGITRYDTLCVYLAIDTVILFVPHWFTGMRLISVILTNTLSLKIDVIQKLLHSMRSDLRKHEVEYLMLFTGKKNHVPTDIKFKVNIDGQRDDFLGLYGQVVTNNVQGHLYPYFYMVLVGKKGYGLEKYKEKNRRKARAENSLLSLFSKQSDPVIFEFKEQQDVEVLIIRQYTTKKSGYHTDEVAIKRIFLTGLGIAEKAAVD